MSAVVNVQGKIRSKKLKKFSCETQLLQIFGVSNTLLNTAEK